MRALLICPGDRTRVAELAKDAPLSNIPILGKSLIEYWLEYLAVLGAREILVLTTDRDDKVRALVGDGARWGLHVIVLDENHELTVAEARAKYRNRRSAAWLSPPNEIVLLDHLPNLPQMPLFTSYADWFAATRALMPQAALTPERIGVHELRPGIWVGLHTHIAPDAKLNAPCWIGEHSWIETGAIIGPNAILEKEVFVGRSAEISQSIIGPHTFVGQFTEVHNSLAWGDTLINWERGSCLKVPDEFLLCSLEPQRGHLRPVKYHARHPFRADSLMRLRDYIAEALASLYAKISPPC